jgi:hypothetical protein
MHRRSGRRRRTSSLVLAAVVLAGCGSQTAPGAGPPPRNASQVPGTRPSPSIPDAFRTDLTPSPAPTPSVAPTTAPPELVSLQITDPTTGDHVAAARSGGYSEVEISVHGVGTVSPTGHPTLRRTEDGTTLTYRGPGEVDGHPDPVRLRIDARVDSQGLGTADIWIGQRHYVVVPHEPPHDAGPVVRAVVSDFAHRDWNELYDHLASRQAFDRAEFVRIFGRQGRVRLRVTGPTSYVEQGGGWEARTPVHAEGVLDGRPLHRAGTLALVYRDGAWRFTGIS